MHPQTLRIYEAKGLVAPQRTAGNTRLYSRRPRAAQADQSPDPGARAQPRRVETRDPARGADPPHAADDGAPRARDARGDRRGAQAVPARSHSLRPRERKAREDSMDFNKLTIKSQRRSPPPRRTHAARQPGDLRRAPPARAARPGPASRAPCAGSDELRAATEAKLRDKPALQGAAQQPSASTALSKVLDRAEEEMRKLEDEFVSTEHLLLALDAVPRDELLAKLKQVRGGQRVTSQDPEGTYQALEKFGRDLTELAEQGKLDPVIGRDEEIRRVIQVLSRRTKNNPVLIGDPEDGDRRGPRPADRRRRRARRPQGQARVGARHRRTSPGRSTAASSRSGSRPSSPRSRTPRARSSSSSTSCTRSSARSCRGCRRRGEPAQADALARRAARDRRDDPRRVPQAHREGRRARAPLPAGLRGRAVRLGHDRDPPRAQGALRGAPRRADPRRGARRRRGPLRPLHLDRQLPDKAIDLVDEAASRLRMEIDSAPLELDEAERACASSRSSWPRWARSRRSGVEPVERDLAEAKERRNELRRALVAGERGARPRQRDQATNRRAANGGRSRRAARRPSSGVVEIRYGELPELERELEERAEPVEEPMVKEEVDEDDVASVVGRWTGIPVSRLARGRDGEADPHGGAAPPARGRAGQGR